MRKPKLSDEQIAKIKEMHAAGKSWAWISSTFKRTIPTCKRYAGIEVHHRVPKIPETVEA